MRTRQMGPDGPQVSAIGVGAMSFSDFYGPTDEAASHAVLDAARDLGVTHVDTANVYGMGKSERAIGTYLTSRGAASRKYFHIATKAGISRDATTGSRRFDNSRSHLTTELEASLTRLCTDHVDVFYVHRRDPEVPIEEVTETLAELVRAGKARSFGFSEIAPSSLRRAAAVQPVAAVQSEYSLATRYPDLGLVQTCAELGTALVAFSPVGRSLLTDTPISRDRLADIAFARTNPRFQEPNLTANLAATDRFRALAADMGHPAAALSIAWLLAQSDQIIPIPGTRTVPHFYDLVRGAHITLSDAEISQIEQVLPVGWAHGDRYSSDQWQGPERYC